LREAGARQVALGADATSASPAVVRSAAVSELLLLLNY
jgi:hypothetical protein